jgi:hypothetical protein
LRGTLLHLVDANYIKKIGHSSLQYGFFFSKEFGQIILGMIRDISLGMIQLVHYIAISDKLDSDLKIKKCDGCLLNERNNNKSKNCWVSLYRKNTFSLNITARNVRNLSDSEWLIVGLQYREIEEILRRYGDFIENSKQEKIKNIQENLIIENEFEKKKKLIFNILV